jgi:hypothetical protein
MEKGINNAVNDVCRAGINAINEITRAVKQGCKQHLIDVSPATFCPSEEVFIKNVHYSTKELIISLEQGHDIESIEPEDWTEEQKNALILKAVDCFDYIIKDLVTYLMQTVESQTGKRSIINDVVDAMNDETKYYTLIEIEGSIKYTIIEEYILNRDLITSYKENEKVRDAIDNLKSVIYKYFNPLAV